MRWSLLIPMAYLCCALDAGLTRLIGLPLGGQLVAPSFLLILCCWVALWATQVSGLWAGLFLGLLTDALGGVASPDGRTQLALIGPHALGFMLAAYTVQQIRGMLLRPAPAATCVSVLLGGLMALLLTVMLITGRGLYAEPIPGWRGTSQLYWGGLSLLYSTLLALPVAWLLNKTWPYWGFDPGRGPSPQGWRPIRT